MPNIKDEETVYVDDTNVYNRKIETTPKPKPEIGVEYDNSLVNDIVESSDTSAINMNALESFLNVSRSRDQEYKIIDDMCQDSIPSAALELYSEDATATNDDKEVVWVTAEDPKIQKTVTFIIRSFQVNKHIYKWASSLIKYGDIYVRLYKQSEYENDPIFKSQGKKNLNEDVNIHLDKESDHIVNYAEMVDNPATVFELTRFGKTAGFIQTQLSVTDNKKPTFANNLYTYSFNKNDIDIYQPDQFVHGSISDNVDRVNEEVEIIIDDSKDKTESIKYKVRSGQSVFYNLYKIWRELSLLETSLILNRLTKSSVTRIIQVETGNTAKEETSQILQSIKQLIEQKASLNPGVGMAEYTNPGPLENNIYMPTHDGKGVITTSTIGGEYDPKQLTDMDYFKNKFYGALGIPKQYFGDTDDGAGFNGGQSLTIISSKYAKKIIKIQSALIEMIKSLVNIVLVDRNLSNYVNKFTINMLAPMTQEDLDRRDYNTNQISLVRDVMDLMGDIDEPKTKLEILKSLLSKVINNSEVTEKLQETIDSMEEENVSESPEGSSDAVETSYSAADNEPLDLDSILGSEEETIEIESQPEEEESEENILPTPEETGVDLLNSEE